MANAVLPVAVRKCFRDWFYLLFILYFWQLNSLGQTKGEHSLKWALFPVLKLSACIVSWFRPGGHHRQDMLSCWNLLQCIMSWSMHHSCIHFSSQYFLKHLPQAIYCIVFLWKCTNEVSQLFVSCVFLKIPIIRHAHTSSHSFFILDIQCNMKGMCNCGALYRILIL